MNKNELTYWVTLALMPQMWTRRKNEIYSLCFTHNPRKTIVDLFEDSSLWAEFGLTDEEIQLFISVREQLANNAFLVEDMLNQGYEIIPIHSADYPVTLKNNLKMGAPTVIYTKGDKRLLQAPSVAIVGSRSADEVSLRFTQNVAKKAVTEQKTVVSGFAKGVDRQALDAALEANGTSIIVLPQGIMTFAAGFKEYYKPLAQGRLLVMSTFAPKAPWSVELAMARNPIIYGMAGEIYVAQSDEKGGTWSGVIDGLRKQRTIYVRWSNEGEKNANILLAQKGAKPVDMQGEMLQIEPDLLKTPEQLFIEKLNKDILTLLQSTDRMTAQELLVALHIDWSPDRLKRHLETIKEIEKIKHKNRVYFKHKAAQTLDLFGAIE